MRFGEKLRKRREKLHLTQEEVAEKIGITRRAYISYEQKDVRPRKQETYYKLASVLDCDVNYLRVNDEDTKAYSLIAGLNIASLILFSIINPAVAPASIAAMSTTNAFNVLKMKNKKDQHDQSNAEIDETILGETIDKYIKNQRKFQVTALGIIVSTLARKGIVCQSGAKKNLDELGGKPDEYLILTGQDIDQWWFAFEAKEDVNNIQGINLFANKAPHLISRFVTAAANPRRKVSLVVDDEELFRDLCRFKGHNSYNGNMSAILINTDEAKIVKEESIAGYDEIMNNLSGIDLTV